MEGERLGRVVAVALSASPTPVACAAFGVSIPAVPGLPPSSGSASPAVQPDDGEEATTATTGVVTDIQFLNTDVRRTGLWAAPEHYLALHTRSRDRVCVSLQNEVVDTTGLVRTRPITGTTWTKSTPPGPATETALGPATPMRPGVPPVAGTRSTDGDISVGLVRHLGPRS
jgi:hypothetical protein